MKGKRILILEDEAVTALDISDAVESFGATVVASVASGEDALRAAEEHAPDLALFDIRVKGEMDGIQTAEKLWKSSQTPVVFLTAFADEETLARAKLVQPYGYILKPFDESELRAVLEIALHRVDQQEKSAPSIEEVEPTPLAPTFFSVGASEWSPSDFLKRVPPFRKLPEKDLENLAVTSSFRSLERDEVLSDLASPGIVPFIVAAGRIALVKSSDSGKELIVGLLPPGDIFGAVMTAVEEDVRYVIRAEAESTVLLLNEAQLKRIVGQHPELHESFSGYLAERLQKSDEFAQRLAHERVEVRIAAALNELMIDFARSKDGLYDIEITRQQLADLTGTTPETAIRSTKKMERDGMLDLSQPGRIRVTDVSAIEALCGARE